MRVHSEISAIWGASFKKFALMGLSHKDLDKEYSRMNYVETWKIALKAYGMAHEMLERVKVSEEILSDIRRLSESYLESKCEKVNMNPFYQNMRQLS
ncbi:MAG: hypothetical protein QXF77_03130 [Candidatus Jordarchaeales archaeon]